MSETKELGAAEFLGNVLRELASKAAQVAAYETWSDKFSREEIRQCYTSQTQPISGRVSGGEP